MTLNEEQQTFVSQVSEIWAKGLTQEQLALEMGKPLGTIRSRLRYYGLKFGRMGVLVPIHAPVLDSKPEAA